MTLTEVRQLLAELEVRPSKALGQNFLVDANILQIILREADIRRDETVLEIGPGLGMLTGALLDRAKGVFAVEKDRHFAEYVRQKFPALHLIEGDAIKVPLPNCDKVVANLPYNISTPILERLVDSDSRPRRTVVTVQREVAQRLAATPRHKDYGALTVFTRVHYHITIAHVVSPRCFYPSPRVESAIVVMDRRDPRVKLQPGAPFHEIVRAGFGQRRKMLRKLLAGFGDIDAAFAATSISPTTRAEELSLEQWISLANAIEEVQQQEPR
ncbi:MAG TPA: 16S rRNA (adenine(1518)-N(6)/adenine(1519)-N(6))-dimethyltransferase RsmA [Verrucomicrobiae bacterium]|nr:16S rRNA (adenine(1518)-N(6)/adenine(1519)-N(6))-dimethyltransferase RsmA [Verrucomicrobiae bacterium]